MINFRRRHNVGPESDEKPRLLSHLSLASWWSDSSHSRNLTPENGESQSSHSRDWIKGVVICSWIVGVVLSINVILATIAAGITYSQPAQHDAAWGTLYTGSCSTAKNWTTGTHFIINVLATVLLGASNYCMQCLASPSRAEVDDAHSKRIWIRIGIPNIWDLLWRQRGRRQLLGWILMITSLPIHLIYNSAVFYAIAPVEYAAIVAPTGPMRGNTSADFVHCFQDNIGLTVDQVNAYMSGPGLQKFSNEECIDTFAQDYVSTHKLVILVTNESMPEGEPIAFMGPGNDGIGFGTSSPFDWLCDGDYDCTKDMINSTSVEWRVRPYTFSMPSIRVLIQTASGSTNQSGHIYFNPGSELDTPDVRRLNEILSRHPRPYEDEVQAELDDPLNWTDASFPGNVTISGHTAMCRPQQNTQAERQERTYPVEYCLTVPVQENCQLIFSPPICLIVIGCNLVKLICALLAARDHREDVFLTVGDAIASFLGRPDPRTEGSCLLSKTLVDSGSLGWRKKERGKQRAKQEYDESASVELPKLPLQLGPRPKRWFQAVSIARWMFTILVFVCMLIPAIYLLRLGILDYSNAYGSKTIWDSGLGEVKGSTILAGINVPKGKSGNIPMILLANTPQILVTFAYFLLDTLLTMMLGAVEYDGYARAKKPLRVSWPRGAQRSTYYLSLPYRYSLPLLAVSAVLHWLVSQSLFFVQIVPHNIRLGMESDQVITTVGHSPVAIIFAIVVGGLLPLASILLGLRRFHSTMPLAAQCSAAISAACHPGQSSIDDDATHALKPVQWGEVPGVYDFPRPLTFSNRLGGDSESGNESEQRLVSSPIPDLLSFHTLGSSEAVESGFYHCSFTSREVYEPTKGRLYI